MIAVYLCRLMFHGMPPPAAANSIWVILGPIGQGANAIMRLGRITQVSNPNMKAMHAPLPCRCRQAATALAGWPVRRSV
jgi:tellurite resistance protein TehA-like permease